MFGIEASTLFTNTSKGFRLTTLSNFPTRILTLSRNTAQFQHGLETLIVAQMTE